MILLQELGLVFAPDTTDQVTALKNINLRIQKGDFISIIGSNGAGKTSLFNALSGVYLPTAGHVFWDQKDITRWPEYKKAAFVGRVFQDPSWGTAANMTVQDNLILAGYKGIKRLRIGLNQAKKEEFRRLLKPLGMGLEKRLTDNVGLLSGGQRQALTMLMMVLSRPDLVLLDEHTAALDPRNAARILELTEEFYKNYNLTILMITHDMQRALSHGNRLIMMDQGGIIFETRDKEKENLTVEDLVRRFHEIRGRDLTSDEVLLNP